MKTKLFKVFTIICCLSLLVSTNVQGQEADTLINKTQQDMHDMFMKKHRTKNAIGWITLGSGVVLAASGVAIGNGKTIFDENLYYAGSLVLSGGALTLTSVPFFISAGSNKRKAKLALKRESTAVGFKNNTQHISLSFTIPF